MTVQQAFISIWIKIHSEYYAQWFMRYHFAMFAFIANFHCLIVLIPAFCCIHLAYGTIKQWILRISFAFELGILYWIITIFPGQQKILLLQFFHIVQKYNHKVLLEIIKKPNFMDSRLDQKMPSYFLFDSYS